MKVEILIRDGQYFFSNNAQQQWMQSSKEFQKEWVTLIYPIPYWVVPRKGIEDGLCITLDQFRELNSDIEEVQNPDERFNIENPSIDWHAVRFGGKVAGYIILTVEGVNNKIFREYKDVLRTFKQINTGYMPRIKALRWSDEEP